MKYQEKLDRYEPLYENDEAPKEKAKVVNPDAKVSDKDVNLREHDFEPAQCKICRYYPKDYICQVLAKEVKADAVCDAFQGSEDKYISYKVKPEDMDAFVKGMVKEQPYQHKIIKGINTPIGALIIVEDTMKPKPHRFSLDAKFSVAHTSREHGWTQKEVDALIKIGK